MTTNSNPIVINTTTEDLFRNYMGNITEFLWDTRGDLPFTSGFDSNFVKGVLVGDMGIIRKAFGDGTTFMLLNHKDMGIIEHLHKDKDDEGKDLVHIRVFHDDRVIGELVDKEICY